MLGKRLPGRVFQSHADPVPKKTASIQLQAESASEEFRSADASMVEFAPKHQFKLCKMRRNHGVNRDIRDILTWRQSHLDHIQTYLDKFGDV